MNLSDKCVCKICECGRHKCPHKSKQVENWGSDVCSEYDRQYQFHDDCRATSFKPPHNPVCIDAPLSNQTTNRTDFIEHEVPPPFIHATPAYEKPCEPMDTMSSYRNEYTEKPQCAAKPIKPIQERLDNGKFEHNTTNRSCYVPWDVCPPERRIPEKYVVSKEPFCNMTSNRADYVEHNLQKAQSFKPPNTRLQSEEPFSSQTEQRQNFISHEVCPRQPIVKEPYTKACAPFESRTTNRENFTAHDACKTVSCKPPPHRVDNIEPFNSQTTNRTDFIAHDPKPPEKFQRERYVKPEGDMDLTSTYKQQFISQPDCRVAPIRPPLTTQINEPFDGQTSYRQNYQNWDQPANIVQHREKYQPPVGPFEERTTNRMSYVAHNVDRTASCKPPVHSVEKLPFDGNTHYRCEFVDKPIPTCPAAHLSSNPRSVSPEGYLYTGEDDEGHKYYCKSRFPQGITKGF